jgi:hypothetical protein
VTCTVEVYDPVSGAWSAITAPLSCHGVAHTATLMSDGTVLIVGGACGSGTPGIRDDAEVYDPATSTWIATAALPAVREAHTATLVPDGTVLIVGGDNGGPPRSDSALIYDPASGVWSPTGSLATGRRSHTATLLNDGTVLAVFPHPPTRRQTRHCLRRRPTSRSATRSGARNRCPSPRTPPGASLVLETYYSNAIPLALSPHPWYNT